MTEFPETKSDLLLRIRSAEDRDAWDQFVSMYRPVIYRMARQHGLQDADAQDLVQRVLIAVAGAIGRWESTGDARFRHWLRRVTKNATLNALTRQPKDLGQGGTDALDLLSSEIEHPREQELGFDLEARRECFLRAAAIVQSEVRGNSWEAFQLTVIDGLPVAEAAQRLNMSAGGVYAAQGRVMDRLHRVVSELGEMES
ncbi:MAG: sigma-70 family RNA polymerase sigma factor [Planctomycetales bacterium]|nr:sigma-70 family RNA polymerase sigma factor [Planctomycetales bacterium]